MSEDTDVNTEMMIEESEQKDEERESQEMGCPLRRWSTVMMTGEESVRRSAPDRGIEREGSGLVNLVVHLWEVSNHYTVVRVVREIVLLEEVKVLWFEDTLSEADSRNFNLIYTSLLLEGKARNLTDLKLGMVLAEKLLAWLQVMHERLKHFIISSDTFKEKKNAEYDT